MNKYLEKIAEKIELEPGVNYDLAKHDIAVSRQRMSEHLDSKDKLHRGIHSAIYAPMGGIVGYGMASQKIKTDHQLAHSTYSPTPGAKNLVGRLTSKYGIGKVLSTGKALGGLAGAAAIGGLGYLAGGLEDTDKADYKNSYMQHLEKKHDAKISELEGWG